MLKKNTFKKNSIILRLIGFAIILSMIIALGFPVDTFAASKSTTKLNIRYTIKFSGNSATSGKMPALKNKKYGKTYTLPKVTFKKKGYSFKGWATSKSGKVKYKNKAKVKNLVKKNKKSITLYAVWKKDKINKIKKPNKNPYLTMTIISDKRSYLYYVNSSVKDSFSVPANSSNAKPIVSCGFQTENYLFLIIPCS